MHVIPAIILAKTGLQETIAALRKPYVRGNAVRSLREELDYASDDGLRRVELAVECLRTACAAGDLSMVVIDPCTQRRHEVPAEYFDQRAEANKEFDRDFFCAMDAMDLSKQVVADPLYNVVRPYRGWVHGFIEFEFRAWLGNTEIGPLAGPRMRPFFHIRPEPATLPDAPAIEAETAVPPIEGADSESVDQAPSSGAGPKEKRIDTDEGVSTGIINDGKGGLDEEPAIKEQAAPEDTRPRTVLDNPAPIKKTVAPEDRRLEWKIPLERWLSANKPETLLAFDTPREVVKAFRRYCENSNPNLVKYLPKRPRGAILEVAKNHLERIRQSPEPGKGAKPSNGPPGH